MKNTTLSPVEVNTSLLKLSSDMNFNPVLLGSIFRVLGGAGTTVTGWSVETMLIHRELTLALSTNPWLQKARVKKSTSKNNGDIM